MTDFLSFVRSQDLPALQGMLAAGVSPDLADANGSTALIHAAAVGAVNALDVLLAGGADSSQRNKFGETALTVALSRGHQTAAENLLRRRQDVTYAFRKLIESGVPAAAFLLPLLPPALGQAYRDGRAALALASRADCLALMKQDPSCIGGVYQTGPDELMMFSLARIPDCVGKLYVGPDASSLDFVLRHADLLSRTNLQIMFLSDGKGPEAAEPYEFKLRAAPAPPTIVEIEPIDWCNLRCTMCHVSQMQDHRPSRLQPAMLKELGLEQARLVQLGAAFEPMMNKEFTDFVTACANVPLSVTTNATLLTPEIVDALTDHGDVTLNISIDGGSSDVYQGIRRLANFDDLGTRLRQLMAARDPETLRVGFHCTVMQSNLANLLEVIDFAETIGVDAVYFRPVFVRDPSVVPESLDDLVTELADALDEIGRRIITSELRVTASSPHFVFSRLREEFPDNITGDMVFSAHPKTRISALQYPLLQLGKAHRALRCESPERLVRIDANGAVSLCKGFVIGNLSNQKLDSIWNGPAANFVREIVSSKSAVCESCDHFRFCLDTGSRRSIESLSTSGPMKETPDAGGADSIGVNPVARAFYGHLADHRTDDLIKAIRCDRADLAGLVLATGLDPDIPGPDGSLPIAIAAELGALQVLKMLLVYRASANQPDR